MGGGDRDDKQELTDALRVASLTRVAQGFRLAVVAGPDRGRSFSIWGDEPGRVLLGTGPACTVRLNDTSVSRRHVALEIVGGRLRILDLSSTNGTTVNGVWTTDGLVADAARMQLGATVIEIAPSEGRTAVARPPVTRFGAVVGRSHAMQRLYPLCERLALSDVPLVIEGETGTGKEVLAEALHRASARRDGPFVVFDCTTVAPSLLESELFGHEKGAFTGATTARKGLFEQAEGGTLFVDEVGDLDLALQPKLLRAVERREVRRVGGSRAIGVDVRIIAATRRDLDHEVVAGRFRDDLFHRLAVGRIELPALREREGDVRELVRVFCEEADRDPSALPADVLARWEDARWPGNVRELRNAVLRWVALGELSATPPRRATEASSSDAIEEVIRLRLPFGQARDQVVAGLARRYIAGGLAEHGGDIGRAAAASGIGRRYFNMIRARKA